MVLFTFPFVQTGCVGAGHQCGSHADYPHRHGAGEFSKHVACFLCSVHVACPLFPSSH